MDNNLSYTMDMQLEPYNGLEVRFDRSWIEQILLQIGKFKNMIYLSCCAYINPVYM